MASVLAPQSRGILPRLGPWMPRSRSRLRPTGRCLNLMVSASVLARKASHTSLLLSSQQKTALVTINTRHTVVLTSPTKHLPQRNFITNTSSNCAVLTDRSNYEILCFKFCFNGMKATADCGRWEMSRPRLSRLHNHWPWPYNTAASAFTFWTQTQIQRNLNYETYIHTYTRLTALFPGLPGGLVPER